MELKINICTSDSCKVIVQDLTLDYTKESSDDDITKPKYSDTKSLIIIQKFSSEDSSIVKNFFVEHNIGEDIVFPIPIEFDGWFKVSYIVLPTLQWIQKYDLEDISSEYNLVYFTNNDKIYKLSGRQYSEVTLAEIIEVNPDSNTTISKYTQDNVSICNLRKCYMDLVNKILNSNFIGRCFSNNIDKNLIFKRDILWMALNSIKYLVEFCQFAEAQRLIERLISCNGLCSNNLTNSQKNGCGCMHM